MGVLRLLQITSRIPYGQDGVSLFGVCLTNHDE
jgi:hypothetical protein